MHFARIENSARLRRVLAVLMDGTHTTYEIQERARVCAVASSVSELRAQGFRISCKKRKGAFEYTLHKDNDDCLALQSAARHERAKTFFCDILDLPQ